MAHIQMKRPIEIDGKNVTFLDMRFEKYMPPVSNSLLAKWLSGFNAKLPNNDGFLFFRNGRSPEVVPSPVPGYLSVPNEWWNYATAVHDDGSIKEPKM